jgi:hypothetical protein
MLPSTTPFEWRNAAELHAIAQELVGQDADYIEEFLRDLLAEFAKSKFRRGRHGIPSIGSTQCTPQQGEPSLGQPGALSKLGIVFCTPPRHV